MENKFKQFLKENKWFIAFYLAWSFLHVLMVLEGRDKSGFWPFDGGLASNEYYGPFEFLVYMTSPLIIFAIVKLIGLGKND